MLVCLVCVGVLCSRRVNIEMLGVPLSSPLVQIRDSGYRYDSGGRIELGSGVVGL